MLTINATHSTITHKIVDESGKWVGNVTGNDGGWTATHMIPVLIDGRFYGQYKDGATSDEFTLIGNAIGWLEDQEAVHGVALPVTVTFAIEFGSDNPNSKGYGHIHKAGCRDLKDPESFECEPTQDAIDRAANDLTGWEEDEHYTLSPCAKALLEKSGIDQLRDLLELD